MISDTLWNVFKSASGINAQGYVFVYVLNVM